MPIPTPPEEQDPDRTPFSAKVEIDVGENKGNVFGVYIRGDSITYIRGPETGPQLSRERPPYKFLAPYAFADAPLFMGREADTDKVLQALDEQQVVVLWGKAGIGKTSLINAGLMPRLAQRRDSSAVYLNSYNNPLESIRKGIAEGAPREGGSQSKPPLDGEGLKGMARAVFKQTGLPLVLLLDQFELLFSDLTNPDRRKEFINELVETLDATIRSEFSLVIVVDESDISRVLMLQSPTRKHQLQASNIQLPPLDEKKAREAILGPLVAVGKRGLIEEKFVQDVLLPDLIRMGEGDFARRDTGSRRAGGEEECVYPPYLQIVCHSLYLKALDSPDHKVTSESYQSMQGAVGIFAGHVKTSLKLLFDSEEDRECAKNVLVKMTDPLLKGWVAPNKLEVDCPTLERVPDILEVLAKHDLLSARTVNNGRQYSLPNPAVLKAVRDLWGTQSQRQFAAQDELEHLYASWLLLKEEREEFASVGQLRFLVKFTNYLPDDPVRALLMLRAAVSRLEPTRPWLEKLKKNPGGPALIEGLDDAERKQDPPSSEVTNAKLLLGLTTQDGPERQQTKELFKTVSEAAVSHPSVVARETAAISLLALKNRNAVGHVDEALNAFEGWQMKRRRIELRSAMREADPSIGSIRVGLNWLERRLIFLWMLRRRAYRDRVRLLRLTAGGALGVGLALGLLRGAIEKVVGTGFNIQFSVSLFFGSIFGGLIAFGLATLKPWGLTGKGDEDVEGSSPPPYRAAFVTCAVLFGLGHALMHLMQGNLDTPLRYRLAQVGMGFMAGLGISWAVAGDLSANGMFKASWNIKSLSGATLVFLLVQVVFIFTATATDTTLSLFMVNSNRIYAYNLPESIRNAINVSAYGADAAKEIAKTGIVAPVYHYFTMIDSALTGLVFAAGLKLGLSVASKSIQPETLSLDRR